jgi:hypothetical protein
MDQHPRALSCAQLVALLRQQVAELQSRLRASEAKVAMWEECMQQLVHCVVLSPEMNDMYKSECSALLHYVRYRAQWLHSLRVFHVLLCPTITVCMLA